VVNPRTRWSKQVEDQGTGWRCDRQPQVIAVPAHAYLVHGLG
jgi:hypothetical protein